jgi:hypothetical protein
VERLEALHTSIPNAEESMAKTAFEHSQQASAIDPVPPTDRRRSRAAEHPPRRLSPTAGDVASGRRPRPPTEYTEFLLQGVPAIVKVSSPSMLMTAADKSEGYALEALRTS